MRKWKWAGYETSFKAVTEKLGLGIGMKQVHSMELHLLCTLSCI